MMDRSALKMIADFGKYLVTQFSLIVSAGIPYGPE